MKRLLVLSLFLSVFIPKDIIAVLELDAVGVSDKDAQVLTQRLTNQISKTNQFIVVERNQIDKILKEQKFQHSGCTKTQCAVEIGQLLNT